ncbi:MAG: hypothetical protein J6V98_06205 [Bacteroidales bacterium]|nr:hypothetical protein [Bacteroidales bacterium]
MKRLLPTIIFLMLLGLTASAQDIITTKNGDDIQAKVLEVTSTELKYKKHSNLDGPTYTIKKSDVLIVRYENGEKEVFKDTPKDNTYKPNTKQGVREGMRYSEYKNLYDKSMYVHQPGDPYSPSWAGIASFLLPGLGQCVADEWGRGTLFFLANLGLGIGSYITSYGMIHYREPYKTNNTYYFLAITAVRLAVDIWSITDAVKIAKIKNMYNQDMRGQRTALLEYGISPSLTFAPDINNSLTPVTGISVTLSF